MSNEIENEIKKLQQENIELSKIRKRINKQFSCNYDKINQLKVQMFQGVEISIIDILKGTYDLSDEDWYERLKEQSEKSGCSYFLSSSNITDKGTAVSLYIDYEIFEKRIENFKNTAKILEEIKDNLYKEESGPPYISITTGLDTLEQYMIEFKDDEWHFIEKDYKNESITLFKNKNLFDTIKDSCNWQKKEMEAEKSKCNKGFF